jgi:hypothetical protein
MTGIRALIVAAMLAASAVLAGCSSSAGASGGLTSTCTVDDYAHLTVVFTNHTGSDIEVSNFGVAYFDPGLIGIDQGIGLFTVPAGPAYTYTATSILGGGGDTCSAVMVQTGTPT